MRSLSPPLVSCTPASGQQAQPHCLSSHGVPPAHVMVYACMYVCMCRIRARLLKAKVDDLEADLTQHQAAAYHPTHVCTTRLGAGMPACTRRTHALRGLDTTEIVLVCPVGLVCRDAPFPHIARVLPYDLHTPVRILAHVLSTYLAGIVPAECVRGLSGVLAFGRDACGAHTVACPGQTAPSLPPCPHPRSAQECRGDIAASTKRRNACAAGARRGVVWTAALPGGCVEAQPHGYMHDHVPPVVPLSAP